MVERVGGSSGEVSVTFACMDVGAKNGADYIEQHGRLSWRDGDSHPQPIKIKILNDTVAEPSEWFRVGLASPTNGARLGTNTTYTVTIADDDGRMEQPASAGKIEFTKAGAEVSEGDGRVSVTLQRIGGSSGKVSVRLIPDSGTATSPTDFDEDSMIVDWADGVSGPKTVFFRIKNDNVVESTERFRLLLTSPEGGASLGAMKAFTVTIKDDDVRLELKISTSDDDLRGNGDNLNVKVLFTDGSSQLLENVNGGQKWDNGTTHEVKINVRQGKSLDQIRGIRLSTTSRYALSDYRNTQNGDNWNMQRIEVKSFPSSANQPFLSHGYNRFTQSNRELDIIR